MNPQEQGREPHWDKRDLACSPKKALIKILAILGDEDRRMGAFVSHRG